MDMYPIESTFSEGGGGTSTHKRIIFPLTPISRTISGKYRDREVVAPRSKVTNMVSGCTLIKSTIWSHPSRKYRIGIFGRRLAKMTLLKWKTQFVPNPQTQSLEWKAVCIRRASFNLFWPLYGQKFRFGTSEWVATKWVKFENFDLERVFRFGTLHPVVHKVSF